MLLCAHKCFPTLDLSDSEQINSSLYLFAHCKTEPMHTQNKHAHRKRKTSPEVRRSVTFGLTCGLDSNNTEI